MTKTKRLLVCSVVVVGVGGLVFFGSGAGAIFGDSILEWWHRERFDAGAWQSEGSRTDGVRIRMVDDLLRRHRFGGMTREQVTAIVGEPDKTNYFSDWDMVYWLGPERGFMGIDSEWLVFRLDGEEKVSEYQIVED
jgi:hypothetical protein